LSKYNGIADITWDKDGYHFSEEYAAKLRKQVDEEAARRHRISELKKAGRKRGKCTKCCCRKNEISVNVRNAFDGIIVDGIDERLRQNRNTWI
jgi:hypothetical protein